MVKQKTKFNTEKMKKAKFKIYKTSNALILAILALLGFSSSCNKPAEYGTPSADFIINGKVLSNQNDSVIPNIRVTLYSDTQYTDNSGKYTFIKRDIPPTNQTFPIKFQDIDSIENGEFSNLDTIVKFTNPQFVNGNGDWDEGETTKEFNVKLKNK